MNLRSDHNPTEGSSSRPRGSLRAAIVAVFAIVFVGTGLGFVGFLSQLRAVEVNPSSKADVIGDKWRDEPWWTSGATLRLLLSEYAKYVAAEVRVRLATLGLELTPEMADLPTGSLKSPRTATAN